jgi:hypothetical protein
MTFGSLKENGGKVLSVMGDLVQILTYAGS